MGYELGPVRILKNRAERTLFRSMGCHACQDAGTTSPFPCGVWRNHFLKSAGFGSIPAQSLLICAHAARMSRMRTA
jgi:hypothetical protein